MLRYYMKNDLARCAHVFVENIKRIPLPEPDAIASSGRSLYTRETVLAWCAERGYTFIEAPRFDDVTPAQ